MTQKCNSPTTIFPSYTRTKSRNHDSHLLKSKFKFMQVSLRSNMTDSVPVISETSNLSNEHVDVIR